MNDFYQGGQGKIDENKTVFSVLGKPNQGTQFLPKTPNLSTPI